MTDQTAVVPFTLSLDELRVIVDICARHKEFVSHFENACAYEESGSNASAEAIMSTARKYEASRDLLLAGASAEMIRAFDALYPNRYKA